MIGRCDICNKLKFSIKKYDITDRPGSGRRYLICNTCVKEGRIPKSFNEKMGIYWKNEDRIKFVKNIGTPQITDSRYGNNAYGSVLALYDNGSTLPIICGHGGSCWFCYDCAVKLIKDQDEKTSI